MKTKKQETKSRPGRPAVHPKGLPVYESIRQTSGATGIPVSTLRNAKRRGCPAFKTGNRIDLGAFLRWHFENSDDKPALDLNHERALLAEQQRIALELANAERRGDLFNRDVIEDVLWESGLGEMRRMILESLKTYRRQATAGTAVQIVEQTLPKILGTIRETLTSKRAEIDAPVETKSEP